MFLISSDRKVFAIQFYGIDVLRRATVGTERADTSETVRYDDIPWRLTDAKAKTITTTEVDG
jgi:hypothetical protein